MAAIEGQLEQPYKKQLEKFEEWALEHGHSKSTVRVSRRRILASLACWSRTCGVKRGWHELAPTVKKNFIKHGIQREKIMLGTTPDRVRASDIWPDDTAASEFSGWMRDFLEYVDDGLTDSKGLDEMTSGAVRRYMLSELFARQKYQEKKMP